MNLVRNQVFESVRNDILTCRILPGEELRELELALRYGVSKSPVRAAMQKLEFEGLIEIEPRRGHRVKPISISDAEDMLELRVILEIGSLKGIVQRASVADLAALDEFRDPKDQSIEAFTAYNRRFHRHLAHLSGNRRLAEETSRVMEMYDRLCMISLSNQRGKDGFDGPVADHNAMIDALQARDGAAAARVATRHVNRSRRAIMRGLATSQMIVA